MKKRKLVTKLLIALLGIEGLHHKRDDELVDYAVQLADLVIAKTSVAAGKEDSTCPKCGEPFVVDTKCLDENYEPKGVLKQNCECRLWDT